MFKKITIMVTSVLFMAGIATAQQQRCATDEVYRETLKEHPEIAQIDAAFNKKVRELAVSGNLPHYAKTTSATDTFIYDIPLVVHVIHDYNNEYLNDTIIIDAVNYWNSVYTCKNADTSEVIQPFKSLVGDPRIRLHLATIAPDGTPTKGITHTQSYLTFNADDQAKYDQWDPTKYVNIWFINTFGAAETGAAAYAYYPSSAVFTPYYDGVIGLSSYVNYDKAIPHEIGHVFNLEHPWGNTNQPNVACGDDEVWDTPPTKGHEPVGCVYDGTALYDVACAANYTYTFTTASGDSVVDYPDTVNAQNIMDYTYCQRMFTKGQVFRMRTALLDNTAGRSNLSTLTNLAATGATAPYPDLPPIADFSIEKGYGGGGPTERSFFLCANSATDFRFINRSWNDTISSIQWTLSNGASQPSSSAFTPIVSSFSQPGWATISLTATSNAGSNTVSKQVFIADPNAISTSGYVQNFSDSAISLAQWPMFNFYNNQFKWEYYPGAGYDDNSCVRFRSFDNRTSPANKTGNPAGDHDDMYTPGFDLSNMTDTNLNFYTSGAYRSGSFNSSKPDDTLEVWASTTCGTKWTRIALINSGYILNNPPQSTEFVPANVSQWKAQTVGIPADMRTSKTFFRFRYWCGVHGNDMYLDKISFSPYPTEIKEAFNNSENFTIFPNPSSNGCTIAFKTGDDGKILVDIKDITGKTVYKQEAMYSAHAAVNYALPRSVLPVAGMYFITVTNGSQNTTQKFVVY